MPRSQAPEAKTRSRLAGWLIGLSIGGITLASALALGLASKDSRPEMARLVFASVLPLFGTWVGTVLAFYFARENLQAATESTIRLAGRELPSTPVSEVMIPRAQMHSYDLKAGEDMASIKVADLQNTLTQGRVRRLPILDDRGAVRYVVHDSTIAKFAETLGKTATQLTGETLGDLLAKPDLRGQVEGIGFVASDADIGQARSAMRSVKGCNDVFVTKGGQRNEPVIGWLTNTQLAEVE